MATLIPKGVPFTQIAHEAIGDVEIDPYAFRVYCLLMRYANSEGRAWPSLRTMSDELGIDRGKVGRAVKLLKSAGWVTVEKADSGVTGHAQRNVYTVHGLRPNRLFGATGGSEQPVAVDTQTGGSEQPEPGAENGHNYNQELQPLYNQRRAASETRPRDDLWDAVVDVHGDPATKSERGKFNRAVALLREADVTPDEYPLLVLAYTSKYDSLQPAVMTVAARVGEMRQFVTQGPIRSIPTETLRDQQWLRELEAEELGRLG